MSGQMLRAFLVRGSSEGQDDSDHHGTASDRPVGADDLANGGSDRLIDAVAALGTVDQVAARIREHLEAGADHVAVQVLTEAPGLPVREWQALAEATRDLR